MIKNNHNPTSLIKEIVENLDIFEIKALYEIHKNLNPRSKKESHNDWVKKFQPKEDQIKKWVNFFETHINNLQSKYGLNKKEIIEEFAKTIRFRQINELKYSKGLINIVKISLLINLVKYLENLNNLKIDNPRTTKILLNHSYSEKQTSESPLDAKIFEFALIVHDLKRDENTIYGKIENIASFPLQGISIKALNNKNQQLISDAVGENFQIASGIILIPFIRASMIGPSKIIHFKIILDGYITEDENISLLISVEDPNIRQVVFQEYQIDG